MALVEVLDEILDECLVESNVTDQLFMLVFCFFLHFLSLDQLRLQQHKFLIATLEFEVLNHQIGQVGS